MPSYTVAVSQDINRQLHRKFLGNTITRHNKFPLLDRFFGVLSIVTGLLLMIIMMITMLLTAPLTIYKFITKKKSRNISTKEGGSITALKALGGRVVASAFGFGEDYLSSPLFCNASQPFCLQAVLFVHFLIRLNYYVTGRSFNDQISQIFG